MKIPSGLNDPNVYSNYAYKQEPVVIVNNDKKDKKEAKKRTVKELKTAIPRKLRKSKYEQTEEQKLRIYKNYIQPQLIDNNTNDPNNDLVQSLKDVFGKDNKEKLNKPLPTFTYENEALRQKLANDLFDTETSLEQGRNLVREQENNINKLSAAVKRRITQDTVKEGIEKTNVLKGVIKRRYVQDKIKEGFETANAGAVLSGVVKRKLTQDIVNEGYNTANAGAVLSGVVKRKITQDKIKEGYNIAKREDKAASVITAAIRRSNKTKNERGLNNDIQKLINDKKAQGVKMIDKGNQQRGAGRPRNTEYKKIGTYKPSNKKEPTYKPNQINSGSQGDI